MRSSVIKSQRNRQSPHHFDVIIIGAGASGLMCAIEAGKRGRQVLVLDHANKVGKKILMSGGGRCNFTNYSIEADHYLSTNPHFCKSALSRYTQWDFIALIQRYNIAFHEREQGQLFCTHSAKDIVQLLLTEAHLAQVNIQLNHSIQQITQATDRSLFTVETQIARFSSNAVVMATGGLSIPKIGATPFGYQIAQQFGINVVSTRAGLVALTLHESDKKKFSALAGIALPVKVTCQQQHFNNHLLLTHRGLSGPAILQISSYWHAGETLKINLLPEMDLSALLTQQRRQKSRLQGKTWLAHYLPKRLLLALLPLHLLETPMVELSDPKIQQLSQSLHAWTLKPNNTEGYRTAEVTIGGIDCNHLSSKTFESHQVKGLFFIGELLDVTGWLGGYNFQWAWASGWCAGHYV